MQNEEDFVFGKKIYSFTNEIYLYIIGNIFFNAPKVNELYMATKLNIKRRKKMRH